MQYKSDIEIAQSAVMQPIGEIAAKLGLKESDYECYGRYKAKINPEAAAGGAKSKLWKWLRR